jgi:hypothetical protein
MGPLPADQIKTGFAAGTFGWDLAGGDSGRDLKMVGAYGSLWEQPITNSRNSQQPGLKNSRVLRD